MQIDFGAPNKNANNKIDAFDDENEEAREEKHRKTSKNDAGRAASLARKRVVSLFDA